MSCQRRFKTIFLETKKWTWRIFEDLKRAKSNVTKTVFTLENLSTRKDTAEVFLLIKFYLKGIMIYSTLRIYEGDWENDIKHGKGLEICPNGSRYEG